MPRVGYVVVASGLGCWGAGLGVGIEASSISSVYCKSRASHIINQGRLRRPWLLLNDWLIFSLQATYGLKPLCNVVLHDASATVMDGTEADKKVIRNSKNALSQLIGITLPLITQSRPTLHSGTTTMPFDFQETRKFRKS